MSAAHGASLHGQDIRVDMPLIAAQSQSTKMDMSGCLLVACYCPCMPELCSWLSSNSWRHRCDITAKVRAHACMWHGKQSRMVILVSQLNLCSCWCKAVCLSIALQGMYNSHAALHVSTCVVIVDQVWYKTSSTKKGRTFQTHFPT